MDLLKLYRLTYKFFPNIPAKPQLLHKLLDKIYGKNRYDFMEYLNHYPDVAGKRIDPLSHYSTCGIEENKKLKLIDSPTQIFTYDKLQENKLFFDCIISLGNACRPAAYLKKHDLRFFSSPFDWMMSYPLRAIQNFIDSGFDNFFKNKEIVSRATTRRHIVVRDTDTGMISMHHFPADSDMDKYYRFFMKRMTAQFYIFTDNIRKSHILAFISNGRPIEELKDFKSFIDNKFNKNCHIINVVNDRDEYISFNKCEHIYEFHFMDSPSTTSDFWLGNQKKWNSIMSTIHLI